MQRPRIRILFCAGLALALACASGDRAQPAADASRTSDADAISPAISAAVDAPDRSADDRALDAGRQPARLLAFFGIAPGMRVAELGAGGGYTTELLARVVGPTGRVYGQNSPFLLQRFAQAPWTARLAKPEMKGVVRLDRDFDDPFPPDVRDLDAVLIVLLYHDTVWMKVDRERMNRAVYAALKPGGVYGIVDHSARVGTGLADVESLHRIDESNVRSEVEAAGFRLAADGDFLHNPQDTRDWSPSPRVAGERRGTSDRFVLKYLKPSVQR
jgi:predicted methyltransferase